MSYPVKPIPQSIIDIVLRIRREDAAEGLALVSVETNGVADEGALPPFLFEPATFYRRLPDDAKRAVALRAGAAVRKWSKLLYKAQGTHANRVKLLRQAAAIDEEAAYESVSVGLGQVMGFHYSELGYATAKAMFDAFTGNVEAQLRAMFHVADAQGVLSAMKARDWAGAARPYNGPQYRQNDYDTKLSVAFAHWECAVNTGQHQPPAADSGILGLGSSGPVVRALQEMLTKAGVATKADDDFGPIMVGSVAAFQGRKGIVTAVGLIDQGTADAIATAASESPLGLGARETASMTKIQAAVPSVAAAAKARAGAIATGVAGVGAVAQKGFDQVSGALDQVGTIHGKISGIVGDDVMSAVGKAALSAVTGSALPLVLVGGGFTAAVVFHGLVSAGAIDFRKGVTR